jgi:RNA polymerase-interacting CarD/CdnL/TRCF family regulator
MLEPGTPQAPSVDAIIGEALRAARGSPAEEKAALARAERAFADEPSPANRLRLATLLGLLPEPLGDEARAAKLTEGLANASQPGYGRFAAFLASQLAERSRVKRELERAARERERSDKERDKREEALRQQLEALRGIERGIREREERLRRREN